MHRVLDLAFSKCGHKLVVERPIIHIRCDSAPANRQSHYRFQRLTFYNTVVQRLKPHLQRGVTIMTCDVDEFNTNKEICDTYVDSVSSYLLHLGINATVSRCEYGMIESYARMFYAPALVSTGSTMSLTAGLFSHKPFVSALLFDEETIAWNSRKPRTVACGDNCPWMVQRDTSICHCEVDDYAT